MNVNAIKSFALAGLMISAPMAANSEDVAAKDVADMLHAVMDSDRTQMFRFGAEAVADKTDLFSYSLQSLWPINKPNAANQTDIEKEGLLYIVENIGENFYAEEELGGDLYLTAIYPDVAVAEVCATCHNEHKDSPKTDFKVGDVMGGVVIRIPLDG